MPGDSELREAANAPSVRRHPATERTTAPRIAEEAAEWLRALEESADFARRTAFAAWLTQSKRHLEEFLLATAVDRQLRHIGVERLQAAITRARARRGGAAGSPWPGAPTGDTERLEQLYARYRRALTQVFAQRRVPRDVGQDLLQRTFLQAIKKIRAEGLEEPGKLGGYLYRTACNLAIAYWRGELAHQRNLDTELLENLHDETLSLEERVDHELLAKCVRSLMMHLPMPRDREVLLRFYINEEPKEAICRSLGLTDLQFNQVLWRARQRFKEILRKHGVALGA